MSAPEQELPSALSVLFVVPARMLHAEEGIPWIPAYDDTYTPGVSVDTDERNNLLIKDGNGQVIGAFRNDLWVSARPWEPSKDLGPLLTLTCNDDNEHDAHYCPGNSG